MDSAQAFHFRRHGELKFGLDIPYMCLKIKD